MLSNERKWDNNSSQEIYESRHSTEEYILKIFQINLV